MKSPAIISAFENWQDILRGSAYFFQPQIKTINESLIKLNSQVKNVSKINQSLIAGQICDSIRYLKFNSPFIRNIDSSLSKPLMAHELADNFEELDFLIDTQGVYAPSIINDKIANAILDLPYIIKSIALNMHKKVAVSDKKNCVYYVSTLVVVKYLLKHFNIDIGEEGSMFLDLLPGLLGVSVLSENKNIK